MCNAQKMGQVRTVLKKVPTDFKSRLQRKQDTAQTLRRPSALLTVGLQPTPHAFQEFGSAFAGGGKHVSFAEEASLKGPNQCFLGFWLCIFLQGEDCLFTPKAHRIKDESLITHRFDVLFPARVEDPVTSCGQSDYILELMFGWQVVLRHARVWASLQGRGKMHFQISWCCADISWFWMLFHVVSGIQSSRTIFDPSNTTPPRGLLCVLFQRVHTPTHLLYFSDAQT